MTQVNGTQTNTSVAFEIVDIRAAREGIIKLMSELEDRIFDPTSSISTVMKEVGETFNSEYMQIELGCVEKNINTEYDSAILALSKIVMQLKHLETSLKAQIEMESEAKQKAN